MSQFATATFRLSLAAVAVAASLAAAQGIRYESPEVSWYHPLAVGAGPRNPLKGLAPALLTPKVKMLRDSTIINFEDRRVSVRRSDDLGIPVWQYNYAELDDYIHARSAFALHQAWFSAVTAGRTSGRQTSRRALALELRVPDQYYNQAIPKWAQRILGKEPPKLTITGYEEIEVSIVSDYSDAKVNQDENTGTTRPEFKNNYNITVSGSVGKLITVNMSTTNEGSDFEFTDQLKNIKIEYKGEGNELEDDILQEVRAGYTNFEIPSTALSGFSESREGLFGIYTRSKWGPLMLTTVISHERSEPLTETFHPGDASSGTGGARSFDELQIVENKFFFLDTVYRNLYNERMARAAARSAPIVGRDLQVWKSVTPQEETQLNRNDITTQVRRVKVNGTYMLFRRLKADLHYEFLHPDQGYIRLVDSISLSDNDLLGIFMTRRNPDGTMIQAADSLVGDTTIVGKAPPKSQQGDAAEYDTMAALTIIKDQDPNSSQPSFDLMWRNVYSLGVQGAIQITVQRLSDGSGDTIDKAPNGKLFSYVLGLTDEEGKAIDDADGRIYDLTNGYLILPPYSGAPDGNRPFVNPDLGEQNTQPGIYRYRRNAAYFRDSATVKYRISLSGKPRAGARQTSFNLGWGVIENSEKVTADGRTLERNVDYTIYYESGDLELTSMSAQNAGTIKVEYQRESLFNPENKVFMGARGQVDLPGISKKSFIGSSVLYQLVGTDASEKVARLGREPFNKLLLDVNTHLDFEAEWMTDLVNRIPLIATEAPSSVQIDVEAAHSRTILAKGGTAFVDDFESSKQTYPLSTSHRSWNLASPPIDVLRDSTGGTSGLLLRPPAWNMFWFQPEERDDKNRVTEREVLDTVPPRKGERSIRYEPVLKWVVQPAGAGLEDRYVNPWAGIMYWFPAGSADRTGDRYLEMMVWCDAPPAAAKGVLHIDMGEVSENLSISGGPPNNKWDDEDIPREGTYDPKYNTGLDLIGNDTAEYWLVPDVAHLGWDTLKYDDPLLPYPQDPGRDNFREYSYRHYSAADAAHANGLQGDFAGRSLGLLTSEDLNNDQFSTKERFFRFNVPLDSLASSRFTDLNANAEKTNGWYMIRIPLNAAMADTIVDSIKSWEKIKYVRLWWDGFGDDKTDARTLKLARMQFVGNQWEARAIRTESPPDTNGKTTWKDTTNLEVSVINTEDDINYQPHLDARGLVTIEQDSYGNNKREQSLRINYHDLLPGQDAVARRRFQYQALDISAYEELSIVVNSLEEAMIDSVYFVLRFGTDDSSYYEYRSLLRMGWNKYYPVSLTELARLKQQSLGPEALFKARDTTFVWPIDAYSAYAMRCGKGRIPSFANIKLMSVGVMRVEAGTNAGLSGEIWVNELKAHGLQSFSGSAALTSITTQWADLLSAGVKGEYRDGNFRQMTQNTIAAGSSRIGMDGNTTLQLGKIIPAEQGVAIPITANASVSQERPQVQPRSDIALNDDRAPDKLIDFIDPSRSEARHFERLNTGYTLATRYSKTRKSDNLAVNLLADRISLTDLSYKYGATTEHKGEKAGGGDYLSGDTTQTVSTGLKYDLSPNDPPKWTKWKPFEKTKLAWLPAEMKRYELTYLPSTVNLDLVNSTYQERFKNDELLDSNATHTRALGMSHGLNLKYTPISPILDLSYDLTVDRDLDQIVMDHIRDGDWGAVVQKGVFEMDETFSEYGYVFGEKTRRQNARLDFRPKFLDWLTHTANYTAGFNSTESRGIENRRDTTFLELGLNSEFGFTSSFEFGTFLKGFTQNAKKDSRIALAFTAAEKAMQKISLNRLSFNYTGTLTSKYGSMHEGVLNLEDVSRARYLGYQFGARNPGQIIMGDIDDHNFGGMLYRSEAGDPAVYYGRDGRDVKRTYALSTDFRIPEPLSITISKVSLDYSKIFRVIPDTGVDDVTIQFPKVGVNLSTDILNKMKVVSDNLQGVSVASNYTFTQDRMRKVRRQNGQVVSDDRSLSQGSEFRPLGRVAATHKKSGVSVSYEHGLKYKWTSASQGKSKETENSDVATISYTLNKKPDQPDLKLLWWTIPLKGQLTFNTNFNHTHNVQEKLDADDEGEPTSDIRTLSLNPNLAYDFTENVRGTAKYDWTHTDNEKPEGRKYGRHAFGLVVRISF